jgi:hypothetical protein
VTDPQQSLDARLAIGEEVMWRGKPVRRAFVYRTWPLSIFGGVLLLAALSVETAMLSTNAPVIVVLVGLPFVLAALYMLVGHFIVTSLEWENTEYMVTGRQVLIRHGLFRPTVTMFSILGLPHTIIEMRGPNVGNLLFKPREGQGYGPAPGYQTMWPYTPGYVLGFLYIEDPARVQELIEKARGR